MASSPTAGAYDIELPVVTVTPPTERSSSTSHHQHAIDHGPAQFSSGSSIEDSSRVKPPTQKQRKTSEGTDEGRLFPKDVSVSTPEVAELAYDEPKIPEPPIPAYSAIDPASEAHMAEINPTTLLSVPSQLDPTLAPDTSSTIDPHAPSSDADTLNLLRYNELHGHGGAPVTRAPEAVQLSRHRNRETDADGLSFASDVESLPAYGENIPPRYSRRLTNSQEEPQTLAMLFFKFGFFFPAFWIFGALILVTPLRSPNPLSPEALASAWPPNPELIAWVNEHIRTEEDKEAFLTKMHQVEIKWAKRCLLAIILLVAFSAAIGLTIFGVLKGTAKPSMTS